MQDLHSRCRGCIDDVWCRADECFRMGAYNARIIAPDKAKVDTKPLPLDPAQLCKSVKELPNGRCI